jgi:hypothetical protein
MGAGDDDIREIVNSNVEAAKEKLRRVIEIVMGEGDKDKAEGPKATVAAKKGKENVKARVNGLEENTNSTDAAKS